MTKTLAQLLTTAFVFALASEAFAQVEDDARTVYLRRDCAGMANCFDDPVDPKIALDTLVNWVWDTREPGPTTPLLVDVGPGTWKRADGPIGPLVGDEDCEDPQHPDCCDDGQGGWMESYDCKEKNVRVLRGFWCENPLGHQGFVTIRGSGRDVTRLEGAPAVHVDGCSGLSFQDLTIHGDASLEPSSTGVGTSAPELFGILWTNAGDSTYYNVDVTSGPMEPNRGVNYAWWDGGAFGDPCAGQSVHYWFDSRILGFNNEYTVNFLSFCAENWFYGGELAVIGVPGGPGSLVAHTAVSLQKGADLRVFGSRIASLLADATPTFILPSAGTYLGGVKAVGVESNSTFHMHGGVIEADASTASTDPAVTADAVGIAAAGSQQVHTPETAFALTASPSGQSSTAGAVARLETDDQTVGSPFLWPPGMEPPDLESKDGSDLFVETDCPTQAGCQQDCDCESGSGDETHLLIYDERCTTAGPWFNSTRKKCRGEP